MLESAKTRRENISPQERVGLLVVGCEKGVKLLLKKFLVVLVLVANLINDV